MLPRRASGPGAEAHRRIRREGQKRQQRRTVIRQDRMAPVRQDLREVGSDPRDPADLIIVGEITRAHGVRGTVRVLPVTDFPDHLLTLERVSLVRGRTARVVRIERAEAAGRFVLMTFAGIATPEAAEALRGATLRIPPEEVPPLPAGQFYVFQVVGLTVRTPDGRPVGTVVDVLRTGSNDVYVIRSPTGQEILLPAVEGTIDAIDMALGEIVARPPEWI